MLCTTNFQLVVILVSESFAPVPGAAGVAMFGGGHTLRETAALGLPPVPQVV